MPRLPYLDETSARVAPETLKAVLARRNGHLLNLDRLLLYSEPVTLAWNVMFGALRTETTLPARISEIVILRVGMQNRAGFEVHEHRKVALTLGMSAEEIDAIGAWRDSKVFSEAERAALAYADAMTGTVQVPDDIFAAVRKHFDERQTVELTATVAGYNMVSRFLEALQVTPEA